MANANLTMGINGVDKTAAAFNSVKNRARATGAQIRSIMGGAIAAAGAYLSVRSIAGGVEELGKLDDIAAKTKTNVSELSQAVTGFQILGVNTSIEDFARSLAFMRKNTGREGMDGFYQTVEELGKIPDSAERAKKAVEVFGRSGMELMPIIDNASKGTEAIKGVVDAMPSIPDKAAKAGDAVNDAMKTVGEGFHSIWLQAIGAVCGFFGTLFVGGIRQAATEGVAWMEYWAKASVPIVKSTWARIKGYTKAAGDAVGAWWGASSTQLGTQGEVWDLVKGAWNSAIQEMEEDIEEVEEPLSRFGEELAKKLEIAGKFAINYKHASEGGGQTGGATTAPKPLAEEIGTTAAKAAHRVTNQLMMGGSSAANRLAVLGPEYQNEAKKQTDLLRKIADNTAKTAENTDDAGEAYASTDLN